MLIVLGFLGYADFTRILHKPRFAVTLINGPNYTGMSNFARRKLFYAPPQVFRVLGIYNPGVYAPYFVLPMLPREYK
jgi:hypothetical protein